MNELVRDRDLRAEGTSSIKAKAHARPSKVSTNKYLGVAVAYKGRKVITRVMITERWLPFLECLSMCLPLLQELLVHYVIEYAQHY